MHNPSSTSAQDSFNDTGIAGSTSELCEVSGSQFVCIPDNTAEYVARLPDAANEGYNKVTVRTVDTDIVFLAVNIAELWFHFATGRNFRCLAAHNIDNTLGPNKCPVLPCVHAFAGCDTVSCF